MTGLGDTLKALWFGRRHGSDWEALAAQAHAVAVDSGRDPAHRELGAALEEFYRTPAPGGDTVLSELKLLAVDVETTGLDPSVDQLVSVGYVHVDGARVKVGTARQWVIAAPTGTGSVGQSATIHGITDEVRAQGTQAVVAVAELVRACAGRALLAHLALIEHDFISAACEQLVGVGWSPKAVVDTMDLERRSAVSFGRRPGRGEVRLATARASRGLPAYHNHDALCDAIACAELYIAQTSKDHFGNTLDGVRRRRGTTQW